MKNNIPVEKRVVEVLNNAMERADTLAGEIHDSATGGNLDYDKMDAEARQSAIAIKAALGQVHVLNLGQRIIENIPKRIKG